MALESGTYISDLNPSNPVGATDKVSTLDDHVRLIKSTLQNTFPNIDGAVNATEDQINLLAATSPNDQVLRISSDTVGWGQLTAGMFPSQVVPDAALSSNVPLLNATNTFTKSGVTRANAAINIESSQPSIGLYETDAPTDAKYVQVRLDNGLLSIRARTDADGAGATLFSASRNGATWQDVSWAATGEIDLTAPTLDFNGDADISGTLAVGGASTFSGTVTLSGPAGARRFDIVNTDASQIWAMRALTDQLQIGARASNGSWSNPPAFTIWRSGDTITQVEVPVALIASSARITGEGGVIYHDNANNLGGKIVLSSSPAASAAQVGAPGDMRFVYS